MKMITIRLSILFISVLSFGFVMIKPISENSTEIITGAELYQINCASCHGADLKGNPPVFPALNIVSQRMTKEDINKLILTGGKIMPSFSHLSHQEQNAITDFLFGENTISDIITEVSLEQQGKNLFIANCASCHKVEDSDDELTGRKDWGRVPAILGGVNENYSQEEFNNVLNMGPCYMPSFEELKEKQKEAIFSYLSSFEQPENDNNTGCGMRNCACR